MAAHNREGFIARIQDRVGITRELNRETDQIERVLRQKDVSRDVNQKVKDVLTLSRNLKTDQDADIRLILHAIYQLRGVFNPNLNVNIWGIAPLSASQRNAERLLLMRRLDSPNL